VNSAAHVAHDDAALIVERAATRGRGATEGGDERGDVKRRSVRAGALWQLRSRTSRVDYISVSRLRSAAFVAGNGPPLIAKRAAPRGRNAMECGDEHGGAKNALSVRAPASRTGPNAGNRCPQVNARGARRDQGRARLVDDLAPPATSASAKVVVRRMSWC